MIPDTQKQDLSEIDENEEKLFEAAIKRALESFGKEVKAQSTARQEFVLSKLQAEMDRQRPNAKRLLYGLDVNDNQDEQHNTKSGKID